MALSEVGFVEVGRSSRAGPDIGHIVYLHVYSADKQGVFHRTVMSLSLERNLESIEHGMSALTFTLRAMQVRQPLLRKCLALTSMVPTHLDQANIEWSSR